MVLGQEAKLRSERFQKAALEGKQAVKKSNEESTRIGPVIFGVFLFVVVGSAIFQMLSVNDRNGNSNVMI